jgi:hypothetical protein
MNTFLSAENHKVEKFKCGLTEYVAGEKMHSGEDEEIGNGDSGGGDDEEEWEREDEGEEEWEEEEFHFMLLRAYRTRMMRAVSVA